ncbi:hypothetical protein EGR_07336 [Echinococcus granulosus]|uniref:Uncharacterized protein n=1 Tax=Echinococcus granulosus TaxID=6210 RepID=W6U8U7_ECHGR|nr:hypothetical protein EGR_07336 [Echinococcus granulosus]EUB57768.1 hypothetical protein EGR_07336 [Echinococcus granulosus]
MINYEQASVIFPPSHDNDTGFLIDHKKGGRLTIRGGSRLNGGEDGMEILETKFALKSKQNRESQNAKSENKRSIDRQRMPVMTHRLVIYGGRGGAGSSRSRIGGGDSRNGARGGGVHSRRFHSTGERKATRRYRQSLCRTNNR